MDMCREKMIVKTHHQSSSFAPKTYENGWQLGLRPRPHCKSSLRSPRPPSWLKGMGGEENEREGEGRDKERKRRKGKGREGKGR
jgi:hypothetical protein